MTLILICQPLGVGKKKAVSAYDPVYKKWAMSQTVLMYPNVHCSTIHNSQDMEQQTGSK